MSGPNDATPAPASTQADGNVTSSPAPAAAPAAAPATPVAGDPAAVTNPPAPAPAATPAPNAGDPPKVDPPKEGAAAEPPKVDPPKEEVKAPVVPDKYELKLADGSKLAASDVEKVSAFAKANKLTQEEAQKLLGMKQEAVKTYADAQAVEAQKLETEKSGWLDKIKADSELGGVDAAGLNANVELSKRVLTKYGSPELLSILDSTKLGNYPELVRCFSRIGKAMGEDKFIAGPPEKAPSRRPEDVMYAN